ncbi:putative DNA primase/helicase [Geodermatophilus amargosae]|uniref:Putative DNA primase/helicase n=1 Tax=Geodermatophilus amargosae TaxID=1296565 RepID=A0A1I7B0N7_9ACTN|nr:DNA primase family protein [Geodermatophilus amargosae]SFT80761.1 putative DNA primase/helicase [Geodermatophilus amargosae]
MSIDNNLSAEVDTENLASDHLEARVHRKQMRMAFRMAKEHGHELRHVRDVGWFVWRNGCWIPDPKDAPQNALIQVKQKAMQEVARLNGEERDKLYKDAAILDTANNINGTISIAKALPPISASVEELDPDPFLVNTPDGVYDLRTSEMFPHDRKQMHTKITGCSTFGARDDGLWHQFIEQVLPDPDVRRFAQKILGYSMLGRVQDQIFPIFFGESGTGKSTFLDSVHAALGSYAGLAPTTLLLATGARERHPTEIAGLRGQRLVMVHETEKSQPLKTAAMKNMTGGDRLKGRFMAKDFFEFTPSHTFVLVTNYSPTLDADDDAAWDRIRVVPFIKKFRGEKDENVNLGHQILESDLPSVLQWVLDGYELYEAGGLREVPQAVVDQTREHNQKVDDLTEWINEEVAPAPGQRVLVSAMYEAWRQWAKPQSIPPGRKNDFTARLERRRYRMETEDRQNWVMDVALPVTDSSEIYAGWRGGRPSQCGEQKVNEPGF